MQPVSIPAQMRALVLDGTGFEHLQVRCVPTPRPGPRQMLARVDAAGICASLIKLVEQGPAHSLVYGWDITRYPLILGDEGAVTLVEVGAALGGDYRPGQRFVIQPAVDVAPINHRERYRDQARGIHKVAVSYTLGGHLAEYLLVTEEILEGRCLLPMPRADLPYAHAALAEPLSCVISAQDHHVHLVQPDPLRPRTVWQGLKPGGVVVILGAGAMGRMHVDLALSCRPAAVIVADLITDRLEIVRRLFAAKAERLGVTLHTVHSAETDLGAYLQRVSDQRGADDVIVAVGAGPAIEAAQHYAARGGVLNLFGGLKQGEHLIQLATDIVHYREINVTGSSGGSPWDMAHTLDLIAQGEVEPGRHITRIGDLDHAVELLQLVRARQIDGKAIVYPHRRCDRPRAVPAWSAQDEQEYLRG